MSYISQYQSRVSYAWAEGVFAHSSVGGPVHLEQFGMKQQSVGSLCVVVTLFVEVTQFVQVPGRKTVICGLQDVYSV